MLNTAELLHRAWRAGVVVPAFNIPYLPMMAPVVAALAETDAFGLIQVARLEWEKFEAGGLAAVREAYERVKDERVTRLHLDHVPVVDEDGLAVDYEAILAEAVSLGYGSVMVDGSRLSLAANIGATTRAAAIAHGAGVPVEGELGAVLGHEPGPLPSYDELFASGRGFTDPDEAARFVRASGVDWLSVAVGNVHGAIAGAARSQTKVRARLDIGRLDRIGRAAGVPLVLHGGSGIRREALREAFRHGIAKINIATTLRQTYERQRATSMAAAQDAVRQTTVGLIRDELGIEGSAATLRSANQPSVGRRGS